MKKLAILLLLLVALPALVLFALGCIQMIPTITALAFSLVLFLVVANFENIEVRYKDAVLKTFKKQVDQIGDEAIAELETKMGLLRNDLDAHVKRTKSDIEDAMDEAIDEAVGQAKRLPAKWG